MTTRPTSTTLLALGASLIATAAIFAQAPEPVSPGAPGAVSRVTDSCPTFSWGAQPGVDRHELLVYRIPEVTAVEPGAVDTAFSPEAELASQIELPGSASSWTPSADLCLTAGDTYAWTIRSHREESTTEWAEARLFSVDEAEIEMSELEKAIERVLDRYLEQQRIDAATAQALRADPGLLAPANDEEITAPQLSGHVILDPTATAIDAELSAASAQQVAIRGRTGGGDNSAGVLGESTNPIGLNHGVVGLTIGDKGGSAGVLGEVEEDPLGPPQGPRFGVRGISADTSATSAGVRGDGDKGVLGVGDSNATNSIGVMGIVGSIDLELPNGDQTLELFYGDVPTIPAKTGVLGFGKNGVVGLSKDGAGRAGEFQNLATSGEGVGVFVNGGPAGGAADIQLGKGVIKLFGMNDTLTLLQDEGAGLAKFAADGSALEGVEAANTEKFENEDASFFLKTNDSRTVQSGVTLTFAGGSRLHFGTPASGSPTLLLPTSGIEGGGPGSGLDADKLDGTDSSAFITNPPGVPLNMGGQSIINIGSPNSATFKTDGALALTSTLASTLVPSLTGSITTAGGIGVAKNISVGTQVDLAQGASIQNLGGSLVRLQDNPSLSQRVLDLDLQSASGLSITGDDLSTVAHAGASLTLRAEDGLGSGGGQKGGDLIVQGGDAMLGSSEVGGNVTLTPGKGGTPTAPLLEGKVNITGTTLVLDSDAAAGGVDNSIVVVATQGADTNLNGGLRYNATSKQWEIKNGASTYSPILTGGGSGSGIDADTLDGLDSTEFVTLANGEILNNATNHIFHFEDDESMFTLDLDLENEVSFTAGGGPDSSGADVALAAGDAVNPGGGAGGDFSISAGKTLGGGALQAGSVDISAGTGGPGALAPGGDITLTAGAGAGSAQPGGSVSILAGDGGTGDADGGDIVLDPGDKNSSGIDGKVVIEGELQMGTTPQAITGASSVTATTLASTTTVAAPFSVASTIKVTDLNADLLDGESASAFADAAHTHSGAAINSGIVDESYIDADIARDSEVAGSYLALSGGTMTGDVSATPGTGNLFTITGTDGDPGVSLAIAAGDNTGTGGGPDITVSAGSTTDSNENGGDIVLSPGSPGTGGSKGRVVIEGELRMGTTAQAITGASSVSAATLTSTVATGTAPLAVTSTTLVDNLNADHLDGKDAADFATSAHTHSNYLALTGGTMTGAIVGNPASDVFSVSGADGNPAVVLNLEAGSNDDSGDGADVTIRSGDGAGANNDGGDIVLTPGDGGTGNGVPGKVVIAASRLLQLPVFTASPTCSAATLGAIYVKNNPHGSSEADSLCVCIDNSADANDNPVLVDLAGGAGC